MGDRGPSVCVWGEGWVTEGPLCVCVGGGMGDRGPSVCVCGEGWVTEGPLCVCVWRDG